ncbi:hypothetical protein CANARDRAFT_30065 [[Candida] arabinofermentans NRRL YB-2248]|uniref:Pre-mRNA-splicing factor SLU7 n=1 Tax=[Candida] arabinofermentans NRRL YB-2248 TaxID=983967 RepID=A0A1E4SUW5_9ASCO|nr:hypothetical protein CANARDRAFT_30065 [[Candida] arabinofermentans NRRL YB-2248]
MSGNNRGKGQQQHGHGHGHGQVKKPTYDANGKRINDYIPNFIASKPWYYESESLSIDSNSRKRKTEEEIAEENSKIKDRLKHQRLNQDSDEILKNNEPRKGLGIVDEFDIIKDEKEKPIVKHKKVKVKIRNGSGGCENCGSLKHTKRDCLEKPRKVSYKYRDEKDNNDDDNSNNDNDDSIYLKKDSEDWDIKRDRWHGYDSIKDYDKQLEIMKSKELEQLQRLDNNEQESLDEDELEEMRELGLINDNDIKKEKIVQNIINNNVANNPLANQQGSKISARSLDEKARYLEVIKTGEELRFNPKSRVYKDLKEGYLNDRGQFVRYLNGEAEEFEKLKIFARGVQDERKEMIENDNNNNNNTEIPLADVNYTAEVSPTGLMLAMKEKEKNDELLRAAKRKELLKKYGAIDE